MERGGKNESPTAFASAHPVFGPHGARSSAPPPTPSWAASRVAEFTIGATRYTVNGQPFFMDVAPYTENGHTYLPVRYVAYALGVREGNIFYNNGVVTLMKDDHVVQMTIGSKTLLVNGATVPMDVAPVTKNGRTMVPLRWVAQAFGASVDWDPVYQKVTVSLVAAEPISQTSTGQVVSQTQIPQTETAATNYTTTAGMNTNDYWQFYVTAVNSAGESSASNTITVTPPNIITVTPPETSTTIDITDDFSGDTGLWQYYGSAY